MASKEKFQEPNHFDGNTKRRQCIACKKDFPATLQFFIKNRSSLAKSELSSRCKICLEILREKKRERNKKENKRESQNKEGKKKKEDEKEKREKKEKNQSLMERLLRASSKSSSSS